MGKASKWQEEVEFLQSIIEKTDLDKTIKWGTDVYTFNGKNVVACMGFRDFFSLWFYDGVFLSDPYDVLITASEGKTRALRQWRFTSMDEIDEKKILAYIQEAIQNVKGGKSWKPESQPAPDVPELFDAEMKKNNKLKEAFFSLTPYKQKEYIEYLDTAKREQTKIGRLNKIIPMILEGTGLHDKYRKN